MLNVLFFFFEKLGMISAITFTASHVPDVKERERERGKKREGKLSQFSFLEFCWQKKNRKKVQFKANTRDENETKTIKGK